MQLPEVEWKKVLALAGVIVALGILWTVLSFSGTSVLRAWFSDPVVSPGSKTVLNVEVNNLLDSDVQELVVSVEPKDKDTVIVLTDPSQRLSHFGKGENRILQFPVMVGGSAVSGRYSIVVRALLDGKEYHETVFIEVKK